MMMSNLKEGSLSLDDCRNQSVSPMSQLLACLRLYASAGHLLAVADLMKIHESTVSRIVVRVSVFIKMPQTEAELRSTQTQFYQIAGFPRVIGAIDCTHVIINSAGTIYSCEYEKYYFDDIPQVQNYVMQVTNKELLKSNQIICFK